MRLLPTSWRPRPARLLPASPAGYEGPALPLALLLWVLLLRYRGLVPLVLLVFLVEPGLRELAGALKPLETLGTAPGAALNWAAVPVLAAALWLSLCPAGEAGRRR